MSENIGHNPEMEIPSDYKAALAEFFDLLDRDVASPSTITLALNTLLSQSIRTTPQHFKQIVTNWSDRYSYDIDGALPAGTDTIVAPDDLFEFNGDVIADNKLQLLSQVTALLVASEYSRLPSDQRHDLLRKAARYLENLQEDASGELAETLLPYVGLDAERAGAGLDPHGRRKRGRFVLRALNMQGLIDRKDHRKFRRALA